MPATMTYTANDIMNTANANTQQSALAASKANAQQTQWVNAQQIFNSAEAQKNRDWQEYLSNTAHQREVADMLAAGINPVLSVTGGSGAAVGSGATASSSIPSSAHMGQVDMSQNGSIVSMITGLASAAAAVEASANSAGGMIQAANLNKQASQYTADKHLEGIIEQNKNNTLRTIIETIGGVAKTAAFKF